MCVTRGNLKFYHIHIIGIKLHVLLGSYKIHQQVLNSVLLYRTYLLILRFSFIELPYGWEIRTNQAGYVYYVE